jgi:hypothetical protein
MQDRSIWNGLLFFAPFHPTSSSFCRFGNGAQVPSILGNGLFPQRNGDEMAFELDCRDMGTLPVISFLITLSGEHKRGGTII